MPRPCVSPRPLRVSPAAGRLLACAASLALMACASPPTRPPSPTQALASASSERGARALQRGDWPQALAQYQATLQAAVALQDPALTGAALLGLSLVQARLGALDAANAQVDQILARPAYFDAGLQARAAARKAVLALDGPQPGDALRWADRAELLCAAPCALAPLLGNLRAHAALARGDTATAASLADAAGRAAQAAGQDGEQASALRLQARALGRQASPSRPPQRWRQPCRSTAAWASPTGWRWTCCWPPMSRTCAASATPPPTCCSAPWRSTAPAAMRGRPMPCASAWPVAESIPCAQTKGHGVAPSPGLGEGWGGGRMLLQCQRATPIPTFPLQGG